MGFDLIIINGMVATAGDVGSYAIGIKDGKIAVLSASFSPEEVGGAENIDAEGGYVFPGGVDAHVHLSADFNSGPNPDSVGGQCADDFETGSRSAVAGGTTTMLTFATLGRNDESLVKVVEDFSAIADKTGSYIDYGFHIIITRADRESLARELPILRNEWGITSCKLFLTYAAMKLTDYELLDVFSEARKNSETTMVHAENGDMIEWLTDRLQERGFTEPYYHTQARIPIAEGEATSRAIVLAELVSNPILFVHVSASSAMEVIRAAQTRGLSIFAETCPQYLHLTWEDLRRFHAPTCFQNSKMICSPPPGPDTRDQEALWTGLRNGTFTIYSSDHCPFRYNDVRGKMLGIIDCPEMKGVECNHEHLDEYAHDQPGNFRYVPNGCPGVETRLPLLYNYGLATGRLSPEKFVQLTSTNAAKLYGCYPQKGALLPGLSDADMMIWYPEGRLAPFKLTNDLLHHDVDYTPFEGMEFTNWPRYTILRGKVMWANGKLVGKTGDGKYLKRGSSLLGGNKAGLATDPRRVPAWLNV